MAASNSYFVSDGHGAYVATEHAGSAWNDDGLHFSPVAGLAVHHLEQERARGGPTDKLIGRLSFDISGACPTTGSRSRRGCCAPGARSSCGRRR